jgi:flagellar export protein FliJ
MTPKFSLQSVLDYRHNRVEVLEVELGRLQQTHKQGQTFLEVLQNSRGRVYTEMAQAQQGDLDLFMLSRLRSSLKVINQRIEQQQQRLKELAEQMEIKRVEVVSARQDEQVLMTLKDKEIERYVEEQALIEKHQQDDVYNSRAYRQSYGAA